MIAQLTLFAALGLASGGNRLAYLDDADPFYVHAGFPRLTTPMWFGEEGVDAVVLLGIDDLTRNLEKYTSFLEPVLRRLAEVEGRSPLSIFTCDIDPAEPRLQELLRRGVRFEVHTRTHPCPLLGKTFAEAVREVGDCADRLAQIPNTAPAVFRMPCCDSINSASPRFFAEILPRRTPGGRFLAADSSVLMFADESFRPHAPFRNFTANATGYHGPYVLPGGIWEFPILAPTDWQAQNLRGANHPLTVADMTRALDIVIAAQGLATVCFHPHGWIQSSQLVEVIDHVAGRHGRRVRFIEHQEALERMHEHLLAGAPLRNEDGSDGGVRLIDVDADGHLDVLIGNAERREMRRWDPVGRAWRRGELPFRLDTGARFGILDPHGFAAALLWNAGEKVLARFDGKEWRTRTPDELTLLDAADAGRGLRLRDIDGDGVCELLAGGARQNLVLRWDGAAERFQPAPYALPGPGSLAGPAGEDRGLRFADLDLDRHLDLVLSNQDEFYVRLFAPPAGGWSRRVIAGRAGAPGALPVIAGQGRSQGAWIRDRVLYVANESTARLPDLVDTRDFARMVEHMPSSPLEAEAALATLRLPPGFEARLFAAEPLVQSPVAINFGPDGRVWVVEMPGYPLDAGLGGRVKVLRDRDGDGRADDATVFADGLSFPSGALWHGKGVLVTCAPDILHLEDTDGDGKSDVRRVVYTGFGEGNQQHRVNGLHWGLDGWIYGANGDSGGEISAPGRSGPALRLGWRDFRFRPDFSAFEAESGRTQFGLALDDFGRRFGASNARHLLYAVISDRYLARNPYWAAPDPVIDAPEHGAMARIFPLSRPLLSLNDIHVPGHFSSACGVAIYRGGGFPGAYRGSAYVCEPVANVVHRDVIVEDGAVLRARRGEDESEFLASADNWFRPVHCATGPDDALYVVDMHRFVLEHPQYIPEALQSILDFDAGRDRGRIYRIVWTGAGARASVSSASGDLTALQGAELAAAIDGDNGWRRDCAQRLILDRRDVAAAPALRAIASSSPRAAARAQALWTLTLLDALNDEDILAACRDGSPAVRAEALRLAEPRLASRPELLRAALHAAGDESPRVRLQAVLTLGETGAAEAAGVLASVLRRDGGDRWTRAAVASSARPHAARILAALFTGDEPPPDTPPFREAFEALAATLVRQGDWAQAQDLVSRPAAPTMVNRWHLLLLGTLEEAPGVTAEAVRGFDAVRAAALEQAQDRDRPVALRRDAIRAAAGSLASESGRTLLEHAEPPEIQLAAARALIRAGQRGSRPAWALLADSWRQAGPLLRGEVLEGMLSTAAGCEALLDCVRDGAIAPREVDAGARRRLAELAGGAFRARAAELLPPSAPDDRDQAVRDTLAAVRGLRGDVAAGRAVFRQTCAPCHRLDGDGFEVGPDLAEARAKGDAALIEAIVNPGRMVPPRYTSYEALTGEGVATGVLVQETAAAVTLRRAGGVEQAIPRADLRQLRSTGLSLMPLEIEKTLPPQSMADLMAYLAAAPQDLASVTAEQGLAARQEALAAGHDGVARVLRAQGRVEQASWLGRLEMHYVRQLGGDGVLEWQTPPAPSELAAGGRHTFRFPAAAGFRSQPAGGFTLFLGDVRLLEFDVSLESAVWDNPENGARLAFEVRARDREDATGLMTLEVPAGLLDAGKPAALRVVGGKAQSRRWFGVFPLR